MSEAPKAFVVTDRRKFSTDGTPRPDADPSPAKEPRPEAAVSSQPAAAPSPTASPDPTTTAPDLNSDLPPAPTAEQMEQSRLAYQATAERLDIAIRASNPGMEHLPPMNFERLVQSLYMSAIMQLGGGTPEGEQPRIDIMGARQSVDMLDILAAKTKGNISPDEITLLDSAIFELRLAYLEITQALARSAAAKAPAPGVGSSGSANPRAAAPGRPTIVR